LSLVVDASVTLAWYFPDESNNLADAALDYVGNEGALVPIHWRAEITNGLTMGIRRNRISMAYRAEIIQVLQNLPFIVDAESHEQMWSSSMRLADRYGLSIYDAAYLELAQRKRLPLATLDKALQKAALDSGVELFGLDR